MNAAQYGDEWSETKTGCFRAWYVCMQDWKKTYPVCGTLMPSQAWTRRHEDPCHNKQRWYCVCCETRYYTKFGMLVEFHCKGVSTFMLAEVSNHDAEDVRAMYLQAKHAPADAKELYKKLPVVLPMDPKNVLRRALKNEIKANDVDYKIIMKLLNPEVLMSVPRWNWDSLFVLMGDIQPKAVD